MKRTAKTTDIKLPFQREAVRNLLTPEQLAKVNGGSPVPTSRPSCATCVSW